MQYVTCVSNGLPALSMGVTRVMLLPSTLRSRPDSSPTHRASPERATQVGTESLGKLFGLGARHPSQFRIVILPSRLTKSTVLEPASATYAPFPVASTPYGVASCS